LNRKKFTAINKFCSELLPVGCGEPQGSILCPLLFLIYVNDIRPTNATGEDNINLFADDTSLIIFGSNEIELTNKAMQHMKSMCKWFIANKLILSVEKPCYTVFPAKLSDDVSILIDNCKLTPVKTYKYFGVFIDDNLKWDDHIEHVYKKIVEYVGIFYK
jgi:ribonuclease P/MRP protein subunit RPP40